jgi:glycosyltransferase involved in cell wall biosynthesis
VSGDHPLFTVVIPVYEGAGVIERSVRSVLAQELTDWELVVVDDGSSDGSGAVALRAANGDARVNVVTQENRGRSGARNAGAAVATGEYLVFLDADDEVRPDWLRRLGEAAADGRAELVHCGGSRLSVDGTPPRRVRSVHFGALFAHQLGPFRSGMFAVRTARFREVGGFAEDMSYGENYELGLRLAHAAADGGWTTASVDEPLVIVHYARPDPAAYDRARYDAARIMLERHGDKLRGRRGALSAQYAVLGVNAARIGRRKEAVSALLRAVVTDPLRLRNYARLARVALPGRSRPRAEDDWSG